MIYAQNCLEGMIIQVIDNPEYTNVVKVGIHCEPDCEPLKFFLPAYLQICPEGVGNVYKHSKRFRKLGDFPKK